MADKQSREDYCCGDNPYHCTESCQRKYRNEKAKSDGISVKVNVDVSEALTGLKALQREAREAAKALRELEDAQKNVGAYVKIDGKELAKAVSEDLAQFRTHLGGGASIISTPSHVKAYGKGEVWSKKDGESGGIWFDKSITDDITRSYGLDRDGD